MTFALFLSIQATTSKAILPVLAAMVVAADAASTVTTSIIGGTIGVGLAALIGQRMGLITLNSKNPDTDADMAYRIPTTDQTRDRPVANPDLPVTVTPTQTTPIWNTYQQAVDQCNSAASSYSCPSQSGSSGSYTSSNGILTCNLSCVGFYSPFTQTNISSQSIQYESIQPAPVQTCGSGYELNNGSCVLTQPQVIPDHNCDLQVQTSSDGSHTYITNSSDPDCSGASTTPDGQFAYRFTANISPDGTSPPIPYNIIFNSGFWTFPPTLITGIQGGGSTVKITAQPADTSQPTKIITINTVDGVVTGATTNTVAGNIATAGTTYTNAQGQVVTVGANDTVIVNPSTTGTGQVAAPSASLSIPTDYARSGEASTAATKISDKLAETAPDTDLVTPDLTNPLSNYFNPLRSWSMPSVSGQCPNGSFTWNNNTYDFHVMCDLFSSNLTIIQSAMYVVYSLAALFIVLGA